MLNVSDSNLGGCFVFHTSQTHKQSLLFQAVNLHYFPKDSLALKKHNVDSFYKLGVQLSCLTTRRQYYPAEILGPNPLPEAMNLGHGSLEHS